MSKIQTKKTLFPKINDQYQLYLKQLKKKKSRFKVRLVLTVILPIFIFVVFIKAAKTFIRIKVRDLFAKPVHDSKLKKQGIPVTVKGETVEIETFHPQRVSDAPM
ncbi:hypothetical protein BN3590_00536 [Clostridium sp. C105KSO15]|nr:hypothetical protein BN3590_00536 [Clostridium sp. C105KSO15]